MADGVQHYVWIKALHVSCALISIALFALCGVLHLRSVNWRQWWLLRVAPHIVDSVLLGAAVTLAWLAHLSPWADSWLMAKIVALLVYILLGLRALGKNTPHKQRLPFFVAALLSVAYIVGVALTHSASWGLLP